MIGQCHAKGKGERTQAGKSVDTVNVHGAGTADTLSAGSAESKSGVQLVLDSDQSIQHHGTGLVEVESVALHARLVAGGIGVPSVDVEGLDLAVLVLCGLSDGRCLLGREDGAGGTDGLGAAGERSLARLDGRGHGAAEHHAGRNARCGHSERHDGGGVCV